MKMLDPDNWFSGLTYDINYANYSYSRGHQPYSKNLLRLPSTLGVISARGFSYHHGARLWDDTQTWSKICPEHHLI